MKVFLVSELFYDYAIAYGVYSSEKKAQKRVEILKDIFKPTVDYIKIQELEVDEDVDIEI